MLDYHMVDDLQDLTRTNLLAKAAGSVYRATGRRQYRVIPRICGGPSTTPPNGLDQLAEDALARLTGSVQGWL